MNNKIVNIDNVQYSEIYIDDTYISEMRQTVDKLQRQIAIHELLMEMGAFNLTSKEEKYLSQLDRQLTSGQVEMEQIEMELSNDE